MIDFSYLYKGLCALANAHRANTMAGHLGAAVVAGYFFGEEQHDLDERVYAGVQKELDRIIRGEEAVWFNAQQLGVSIPSLFEPLPREDARKQRIAEICQALTLSIDRTRQSGHNVIFSSIAVRALQDHPEFATPGVIDGVRKLVESFRNATAGRGYFGQQQGWLPGEKVTLPEASDFPAYQDQQAMVDVVIDELVRTAAVRRQGFGGLWHIINHAAGLVELASYGHPELARQGLSAHHDHVRLYRSLPDVEQELGPYKRADQDPRTPEYWATGDFKRDEARLTHRIKTLYGFSVLTRLVSDPARRQQAWESLRYLMA